ncbi:hypothetical protein CBR_g39235 [Chara braunii]|uniref:EF-hand domain-containing protein n=1 Tax=Chara braunii TaxID=69332 RepID=A0A388LRH5_CHABU|nr:hypothetical protein CBR_g39235 [Chara braunii]|eukprot:GBG84859.1 hypothetical protein CBR_g39235 [Chara braunii]
MADACAIAGVTPCTVPLTQISSTPSSSSAGYSAELLKACEPFVIKAGDGDAKLKKEDMAKAVKALGWKSMTDEEIDKVVSSLSVSDEGSGGLVKLADFVEAFGKSEYVAAIARVESTDECGNEMLEAFRIFDKNGDGKITIDELKQALNGLGVKAREDEVDELMKQADVNRDGSVCYEEFVKLLNAPM